MSNRGSEWHRWEPHIHTPGTILNNQFKGADPWDDYLTTLESLSPVIKAIGVTDYYLLENYQEFRRRKQAGRVPNIDLIFPNIELRLDVAAKSGFVNIHLLVCPDDPAHIDEINRLLSRLHFEAFGDRFDCTRGDLIRLGRRAEPSIADETAALRHGITQFKVNFSQLRTVMTGEWATRNVLIAVAGGSGDGTSGIRQAADTTLRQEIDKFAHVIFSSSPAQREFWLGQRSDTAEELQRRYGGCKPCLHGSDAHGHESVGQPQDGRLSWIKGALTFDSLRQACIDPAGRAYVGDQPPKAAMPSQVITGITLEDADWAETPHVALNPGLVAIIGARGSGKTALADIIAAACDSISPSGWDADENASPSFLVRARRLLGRARVTLAWGGGETVSRALDGSDAHHHLAVPRARYLSQQFVEELCSAAGMSEGLIHEIERIIFDSHSPLERGFATDFPELRDQETSRFNQARERETAAIAEISERISAELEKEGLAPGLKVQAEQKKKLIEGYVNDRSRLTTKGTEAQVARHKALSEVAQKLQMRIQAIGNQRRTFQSLQDEVYSTRSSKAPELLRQARERHAQSGLSDDQWDEFLLDYKGDVDKSLQGYVRWADAEINRLTGSEPAAVDNSTPIIADGADINSLPLKPVAAEMQRLENVFGADKLAREQYAALTGRISQESSALNNLEVRLKDAEGAAARRKTLQAERNATYQRVFDAIISEQAALERLYAPLMLRIGQSAGTIRKLTLAVRRSADVKQWASFAEEELLDLRRAGPFQGRGTLTRRAQERLKDPWENGTSSDIQKAIADFVADFWSDIVAHAPHPATDVANYRLWSKNFAKWLYGTDHITVSYEIKYDGVDIRKLSPGTRGIVLLLLYLALDSGDDRPLIIDQPEENLDPKSVFDELVAHFIAAKSKRQVIIVTHNANLVVNTDADQVIIAEAGPHASGGLPRITYTSGGLETQSIRKSVCDILEGGEAAFQARARRIRVRLDR